MKVLKVIVDEVPYGCEVCKWMTYDGYCALSEMALPAVSDERPNCCPLVQEPTCYACGSKDLGCYPATYVCRDCGIGWTDTGRDNDH